MNQAATTELREARYYEGLPGKQVLCPHDCRITDGGRGACGVRYNHAGKLYTLVYDKVVSRSVEPVEKKPLYHFYPASTAYSVGTVGCNLRCAFCQNWQISQWPKTHLPRRRAGCCPDCGAAIDGIGMSPNTKPSS